jgi:LPXTG-site transpeptidase (sortase) family protein
MNQILCNFQNNNKNKKHDNNKRNIKNINSYGNNINNNINNINKINDNKNYNSNTEIKENYINKTNKINSKILNKYKVQLFGSIAIFVIAMLFLINNIISYSQKENLSKNLLSSINVTRLYSNEQDYTGTEILEQENTYEEDPFVIGILQIEKINVNYPILSSTSRELLKVSLCRCAGPMPNEIGNLCIAGHNLVDYKLFSRLNEINLRDIVKIYDLDGNMCEYEIYKKYEVVPTDLSCLEQNTNGNKIITLLTCNNVNGKRLIVVGKQI